MCGIVGYTGHREALPVLISGLKKLEYRGYDSAGIALSSPDGIFIRKQSGKVAALAERDDLNFNEAKTGIAHTRWATHGPPTTANAHPHEGHKGRVVLVHNGIIENHNALRERFIAEGHQFKSETDSEVLAHLVESHYEGNLLDAMTRALAEV